MSAEAARVEVLRRIRAAIAGSDAPPSVERDYRTSSPPDLEQFVDRLVDYRATVHRCGVSEIAGVVATVIRSEGIRRVVVPHGLDPAWVGDVDDASLIADDDTVSARDIDGDDVGVVTSCAVAIAATGTIVLDAGPGQGRRLLTLIPDHHICVVRCDQVVGSVPDAFAVLDPTRPLTWISGPSATSDIELRRVEGVHGPRHLIVILVDDPHRPSATAGAPDGRSQGAPHPWLPQR